MYTAIPVAAPGPGGGGAAQPAGAGAADGVLAAAKESFGHADLVSAFPSGEPVPEGSPADPQAQVAAIHELVDQMAVAQEMEREFRLSQQKMSQTLRELNSNITLKEDLMQELNESQLRLSPLHQPWRALLHQHLLH